MDPFDEWAKSSTQHSSVQDYADRLVELGASWDTFLSRKPCDIAEDLVRGGIPILAARDIVDVARAAARQSHAPMAIFWDLENMPIPTTSSGRDVSSRLKSILKPYGNLVQFRGYASIGLNLIPQQKRSDLQLSGCLLVDCPHNGRKEVADKMIIVDAMNFAMNNPNGATLCFITGDVDYAYLLAVLQLYKQYRTIVISKGTLQSMLDVNCDMKMRWETDILQLRSVPAWKNTGQDLGLPSNCAVASDILNEDVNVMTPFEPLTEDEEWIDDANFLRNLVRHHGASMGGVRKSLIGNQLRATNPVRFPNREAVKKFLVEAIERGVIWETGEGAFKEVGLPTDETTGMFPAISLSAQIPMVFEEIPERVIKSTASRSYIIFMKWKFCPAGTTVPSNVFVQHKNSWGIFMFVTLTDAQRTVSELPWLRNGILVDWRKVNHKGAVQSKSLASSTTATNNTTLTLDRICCTLCRAIRADVQLQPMDNGVDFGCPECIAWETVSKVDKDRAAAKVVDMLQFLSKNDDIKVPENILRKQLHLRTELQCQSRKWAALWIKHAIEIDRVSYIKPHGNSKTKSICLLSKFKEASRPFPPDGFDTSLEEEYVCKILWDKPEGWIDRIVIKEALKQKFPRMTHPYLRGKVIVNGIQKNQFVLAKGSYGQVVGLTQIHADDGLATLGPSKTEELEPPENWTMQDKTSSSERTNDDGSGDSDTDDEEFLRMLIQR